MERSSITSALQKYADYINEQHAQTDVDNLELNWIIWNVLRMTLWNLIKTRKSYFNVKTQQLKSLYKVILIVTTPTKPTHSLYLNFGLVWHQNDCKDHPPTSHWGNPKLSTLKKATQKRLLKKGYRYIKKRLLWNVLWTTLCNLIKTRKICFNVKTQLLKSLHKFILTTQT